LVAVSTQLSAFSYNFVAFAKSFVTSVVKKANLTTEVTEVFTEGTKES